MECTVFRRGSPVGTLQIEADGLYWQLCAKIPGCREVLRLYLPQGVGVFVPEGADMVCRKRLSRTALRVLPQWASAWCEADGAWSQERDGLRQRYLPQGTEYALRWSTDAAMLFPAAPDRLTPLCIGECPYLSCLFPYPDQVMIRRME